MSSSQRIDLLDAAYESVQKAHRVALESGTTADQHRLDAERKKLWKLVRETKPYRFA